MLDRRKCQKTRSELHVTLTPIIFCLTTYSFQWRVGGSHCSLLLKQTNKKNNPKILLAATMELIMPLHSNHSSISRSQVEISSRMPIYFHKYSFTIEGFQLLAKMLLGYQSLHLYFEYL